jgi:hypothetical protein
VVLCWHLLMKSKEGKAARWKDEGGYQ